MLNPKILLRLLRCNGISKRNHSQNREWLLISGPTFFKLGNEVWVWILLGKFCKMLYGWNCFWFISFKGMEWWPTGIDQEERDFIPNDGYWVLNPGLALGRVVGGHVRCLNALQGTQYWPGFDDAILILEEDAGNKPTAIWSTITITNSSIGFIGVKGIFSRSFQKRNENDKELFAKFISTRKNCRVSQLLPILIFGHLTPIFTMPIGGSLEISRNYW